MRFPNPSCAVALPRVRNNATDTEHASGDATAAAKSNPKAASLQALRAQLRAQLVRNHLAERETEIPAELRTPETATPPAERGPLTAAVMTAEAEARRKRALAMLAARPGIRYAALTDTKAVPGSVLLTLAVRHVGTVELLIPADKWDGVLFLEMLECHALH